MKRRLEHHGPEERKEMTERGRSSEEATKNLGASSQTSPQGVEQPSLRLSISRTVLLLRTEGAIRTFVTCTPSIIAQPELSATFLLGGRDRGMRFANSS